MPPKAPSRKREVEIMAALISGLSQRKTSKELGVSLDTVKRVASERRQEIEQERRERAQTVASELKDRALYAARRLEDLMDSSNDAVAISAVRTALAEGLRWFDAIEMDRRLAALEERTGLRVVS